MQNSLLKRMERVERIEKLRNPDVSKLSDSQLEAIMFRSVQEELTKIKYPSIYYGNEIKDRETFMQGLRIFAEYCFPEHLKEEHYNEERISYLGDYFEKFKDRLLK